LHVTAPRRNVINVVHHFLGKQRIPSLSSLSQQHNSRSVSPPSSATWPHRSLGAPDTVSIQVWRHREALSSAHAGPGAVGREIRHTAVACLLLRRPFWPHSSRGALLSVEEQQTQTHSFCDLAFLQAYEMRAARASQPCSTSTASAAFEGCATALEKLCTNPRQQHSMRVCYHLLLRLAEGSRPTAEDWPDMVREKVRWCSGAASTGNRLAIPSVSAKRSFPQLCLQDPLG
jgi:hypothetical protein